MVPTASVLFHSSVYVLFALTFQLLFHRHFRCDHKTVHMSAQNQTKQMVCSRYIRLACHLWPDEITISFGPISINLSPFSLIVLPTYMEGGWAGGGGLVYHDQSASFSSAVSDVTTKRPKGKDRTSKGGHRCIKVYQKSDFLRY